MKFLYWIDVFIYLCLASFLLSRPSWDIQYLVGSGIAALGLSLWILARLQLGKSFSVSAQAKKLVTTGLYSKFRHPIYYFAGVAFSGLFIAWGKLYPFLVFLLMYSFQILRMKKEEAVLEQAFGDEYRRYRASTWF
jgi:protein-S-isoprenylcysteine O-methyltransferase Ste14